MPQPSVHEISDFAGGLTENFLPGNDKRFTAGDNFYLEPDGDVGAELNTRDGSQILDDTNYRLPTGNQRVSEIINMDFNTDLLGVSGKKIYYLNPNWTSLLGPTGNDPFSLATADTIHRETEWKHHLLMTSDAFNFPVKIYRDGSNTMKMVTSGLPEVADTANQTQGALLASLIALEESLRTQIAAHLASFGAATTNQHRFQHTSAAATAFAALIAPINLATLAANTTVIATLFDEHIGDAQLIQGIDAAQAWHWNLNSDRRYTFTTTSGTNGGDYPLLNFKLDPLLGVAAVTETLRLKLNDIRDRWNMHTYSTFTHGVTSTQAAQRVTLPEVVSNSGPVVTTNLGQLIAYANSIYNEFVSHIGDTSRHIIADTGNVFTLAGFANGGTQASDKTELIIQLAHLMNYFANHTLDAELDGTGKLPVTYTIVKAPNTGFTFGSPSVSGILPDPSTVFKAGDTLTRVDFGEFGQPVPPYHQWQQSDFATSFLRGTTIASFTGTDTINFSNNYAGSILSIPDNYFICSASKFHHNFNGDPSAVVSSFDAYNLLNLTLNTRFDLSDLAIAFTNLKKSLKAHITANNGWSGIDGDGKTFPPHFDNYTSFARPKFPALTTSTSLSTDPVVKTYLYQFVYLFDYFQGTVEFQDRGPTMTIPRLVESIESPATTGANPVELYPTSIASIPVLANTADTNYDTNTVKVEIYRTQGDGINYFEVGSVTNGTTTFSDSVLDTNLLNGLSLYTNGGIVNNDQAPKSTCIHQLNGKTYYGDIIDVDGSRIKNRIRESIQDAPSACPSDFFDDLDFQVKGISSYRNILMAFTLGGIYRLSGGFDIIGRGALTHDFISDKIGCISSKSIVQTEAGVFFAGTDGFYWTDGYQLTRISNEFNKTYRGLIVSSNQKDRIYGKYDIMGKRVWWATQTTSGGSGNDLCFIVDLRFGIKPDAAFTTASSGTDFQPSCIGYYKDRIYRGDERGYIFKHDPTYFTDPKVDTTVAATLWATKTIRYNYLSCSINFGVNNVRKWVSRINLMGQRITDLSVQINSIDDNGRHFTNLKPIRMRGFTPSLGSSSNVQTPPASVQSFTGLLDVWRRFVSGALRCSEKQIQITNAYVIITNSDTLGVGTASGVANTFTLNAGAWGIDAVDYAISFSNDGYTTEWIVTAVAGGVITVADPGNTFPTGINLKWELRGFPKGERLNIHNYSMRYVLMGGTQVAYGGDVSEGGANT